MDWDVDRFVDKVFGIRVRKGISARKMSEGIDQSESYVNKVDNHKITPSMPVMFAMLRYLDITPAEFFDEGNQYPAELRELIEDLKTLDAESLEVVAAMVKKLKP